MKRSIYIRLTAFAFAFLMIFSCIALTVSANTAVPKSVATSDIDDDLKVMEAYLKNKNRYILDETVDYCEIFDLIEFGYDYNGRTYEYGLYLYVYNPSGKVIETNSAYKNKIQLRAAPVNEKVAGGDIEWDKYSLKYLDKTSDNVFYKFKINIPNSFMRKPDRDMRIYEIADLELFFEDEYNVRSTGAAGKWVYTGYQGYHGENITNSKSTLKWESTNLQTLDLELNQASWTTESSAKGAGWHYELSSVYFSVPDKIIKDYGDPDDVTKGLVEIDGTYENRLITGISTVDDTVYNQFGSIIGKDPTKEDLSYGFYTYSDDLDFDITGPGYLIPSTTAFLYNSKACNLEILFYNLLPKYSLKNFGDVYHGDLGGISREDYEQQIENKRASGGLYSSKGSYWKEDGKFNVSTKDKNGKDVDLSKQIITMYDANGSHSFWDWIMDVESYPDESYKNIAPIVAVDESYVIHNKDSACGKKYYINDEYSSDFCKFVKDNSINNTTFLIRFAVTDYYCEDIFICREGITGTGEDIDFKNGNYYFRDEVFLDFDILSLTWENKNGVRTVIPVKANPINITGSIGPDGEYKEKELDDGGCTISDLRTGVLLVGFLVIIVVIFCFKPLRDLFGLLIGWIGRFFGWLFSLSGKLYEGEKKLDERKSRKNKLRKEKDEEAERNAEKEKSQKDEKKKEGE